jgi:hypothetical protein
MYTVRLTATGPGGTDDETKVNFINVVPASVAVDIAALKDNTIYSNAAAGPTQLSNGMGDQIVSGRAQGSCGGAVVGDRRALIEFDVASAVPAGATILTAVLELTTVPEPATPTGSHSMSIHPVEFEWGEGASSAANGGSGATALIGDATWTHRFHNTQTWNVNGGDFGAASASTIVNAQGTYSWSGVGVVSDVQGWLDAPASNHGWLLLGNEAARSAKRFHSKDGGATPPRLRVTYEPPF